MGCKRQPLWPGGDAGVLPRLLQLENLSRGACSPGRGRKREVCWVSPDAHEPPSDAALQPGAVLPTRAGTGGSAAECAGAERALETRNPLPSLPLLLQYRCGVLRWSALYLIDDRKPRASSSL